MEFAIPAPHAYRAVTKSTDALDFFSLAERADTPYLLHLAFRNALQRMGIAFFQLVRIDADENAQILWTHAASNSPASLVDLHLTGDALPTASARRHSGTLVMWPSSRISELKCRRIEIRDRWMSESLASGMLSGASITLFNNPQSRDVFRFGSRSSTLLEVDGADIGLCSTIAAFAARQLRALESRTAKNEAARPTLSSRELEVVRWCRDGKSYPEIATILGISAKTIEFHMTNAMRKFGVNQKISVILAAARFGLIEL